MRVMKKWIVFLLVILLTTTAVTADAQCSICTRTAQQMGEKPARGLNAGIIYLALTPLAIIGFVTFRYLRKTRGSS